MPDSGTLTASVRALAQGLGARLVAIAAADRLAGAPVGHRPRDFVPDALSVVVMGLPIVAPLMRWGAFLAGPERAPETLTYTDAGGSEHTWYARNAIRNHIERRCSSEVSGE